MGRIDDRGRPCGTMSFGFLVDVNLIIRDAKSNAKREERSVNLNQ